MRAAAPALHRAPPWQKRPRPRRPITTRSAFAYYRLPVAGAGALGAGHYAPATIIGIIIDAMAILIYRDTMSIYERI